MSLSHNCSPAQQKYLPLRVAVSACLVGQAVRYDGGHKQHGFVSSVLGPLVELVPVCPEVEIGLGVPRPPIHVVENGRQLKAIGVEDPALDVTERLNRFGASTAKRLKTIDGYIFKARSPSCGVKSTPISTKQGKNRKGAGLFAAQIMERLPLLPIVEELGLETKDQQINFIQRLEAHQRLRVCMEQRPGSKQLLDFYQQNRLTLMAHGAAGLRQFEHWLASLPSGGRLNSDQRQQYGGRFMRQIGKQASQRRHVVVLRHIAARMRQQLDNIQYQQLLQLIDEYDAEKLSLASITAEFQSLSQTDSQAWLTHQSYLQESLVFKL